MSRQSTCVLYLLLLTTIARADSGAAYSFQALNPQFLTTEITPAVWQYESAVSPATYEPAHGDFLSQFTSPSGRQVSVVVKAPVTTAEYDVPPIANGQSAYDYLNQALYDASGNPRTATYIKFPTGVYNVNFPLNSACSLNYVHWQLPSGASDLVIDGQGSTVNFSDFCLGLNLPNVNRVTFKNFTFSWPNLQIATVATIVAVGGNGNTGYTYDAHIDAAHTANLPNIIAAVNAWDSVNGHWDTADTSNVSYGNGFPADSGVALSCVETPAQQAVSGCTAQGIPSYGVQFKVGQSVLLRHYDYASAISASGNDVTFDQITLQNVIGLGFGYTQGRGLRVANCVLQRMAGQPISAGGNVSLFAAAVGDVVFDNDSFGYSGDDPFDMNTPLIRYTSLPVTNNTNTANNVSTPMNTYTLGASSPGNQLQWPASFTVQTGDTIALFDNGIGFQGVVTAQSVNTPPNGNSSIVTLDQQVSPGLLQAGFIAADLSSGAGARYVIQNSTFLYTSGRALLLQTPFGWVHDNHFAGQTFKQVYVLASQYWGEGTGAQELIIDHNTFDGTGAHQRGFVALDIMAESTNFFSGQFPNVQNEVAGAGSAAPPVNQNIVIADNTFTSDSAVPIVNISSVNDALFSGNSFSVPSGGGAYPVTIHDAANRFFDKTNQYTSWLSGASCAGSTLLDLSDPSPAVAVVLPNACGIQQTVSGLAFDAPDSSSSSGGSSGSGSGSTGSSGSSGGSGSTGSSGSSGGGGSFDPLALAGLVLILSLQFVGKRPKVLMIERAAWWSFLGFLAVFLCCQPAMAEAGRPPLWIYPHVGEHGELIDQLLEHPEGWEQTRSVISGMGFADHVLNKNLTDQQLKTLFAFLKQEHIKLDLEVGAIKPWGVTGEDTFRKEKKMWDRFVADGAEIHGIAMDEPVAATLSYLHKPLSYAVEETSRFVALVRESYPRFVVGDIEGHPSSDKEQLMAFWDGLNARLKDRGIRGIDYVRLDVDWMHFVHHTAQGRLGWQGVAAIEIECHKRHLPFSLIYWAANYGELNRAHHVSDMTWDQAILQEAQWYGAVHGRPDQYVIETWVAIPAENVPETKRGTFMQSVLDFQGHVLLKR